MTPLPYKSMQSKRFALLPECPLPPIFSGKNQRTLIHTPLTAQRALVGRALPGYGEHRGRHPAAHGAHMDRPLQGHRAHLARHPYRAWHTGTVHIALVAEHPQLTCRSELTQSTSEQDLN